VTSDLTVLVLTGLFSLFLAMLPGTARVLRGEVSWGLGNRESPPPDDPPWIGRAQRAHLNLLENLPLFTILVLVLHLTQRNGPTTALACWVFLGARVAHAIVYMAGITLVRTLVFSVSLAAEIVLAFRLLAG
jgi:uncharacterized MAPEG superfamily protein